MSIAPNSSVKTSIKTEQNALNQRVAKFIDGEIVEKYLWADLTTLLAIYDKDDNLKQRFAYADSRMPVSMTSNGQKYYLHYDQVGSLIAVSDASHNIVKEIVYDTYGNILNDSNPSFKVPFGFAGGLYDAETKLTRFGYRDYDAYTGKWTAKDPIGFDGGDSNLYGYVVGDPVNLVDPEGLDDRPWPINGRVIVDSGCSKIIRSIDIDHRQIYYGTTPNNVDVDFVEVGGKWYKIGVWNFDVSNTCEADDGFSEATCETMKIIENILND